MATAAKKRKFLENYIEYGFTYIQNSGIQKTQCVVCNETLSAESMKPNKLKRHLETRHPELLSKDPSFFKRMENGLKRSRLDTTGVYSQQSIACIEASYVVSLRIVKQHKPHTNGEDVILPCAKDMVRIVFGNEFANKLSSIPLSNNTVERRISDLSDNILKQIVKQLQVCPFKLFTLQLDEFTDVSSCSQLMVYIRYVQDNKFKEDFCSVVNLKPQQKHTMCSN